MDMTMKKVLISSVPAIRQFHKVFIPNFPTIPHEVFSRVTITLAPNFRMTIPYDDHRHEFRLIIRAYSHHFVMDFADSDKPNALPPPTSLMFRNG